MGNELFLDFHSSHYHVTICSAVDLYHLARQAESTFPLPGNRSTRLAMATIVQAVSAIDATANAFGHRFLFDERSRTYITPDLNDVPMSTLRGAWPRSLGIVDKLRFIFGRYGEALTAAGVARLSELLTYRNWLVHGYVFRTQRLLEYLDDERVVMHEHDREDGVNWRNRFPQLKFNSLDAITPNDAESALRVMLGTLGPLARVSRTAFEIVYFCGEKTLITHIRGENSEIEEVIKGTSREMRVV